MKSAAEIEIRPLGDSAIIVQLGDADGAADAVIDDVLRTQQLLERAALQGVTEITTAFTTVALFYDPARVDFADDVVVTNLEAQIRAALAKGSNGDRTEARAERTIEVPVCYDAEFALDLDDVARHAGLPPDEVIYRHVSGDYRVACVGFTPGFPYLSGLAPELAMPRRATPRTSVPAGSVAIGGSQTGIYPTQSPGGWQVIGRTPLQLFDVRREPPSLLLAGDRVRFRQITRDEFDACAASSPVQAPANK